MFLQRRFYIVIAVVAIIMAAGVWITPLFILGQCLLVAAVVATALEALTLFAKAGVGAARYCSQRFSLGDDNEVRLRVTNRSPFDLKTEIIDELPAQFQKRDFLLRLRVPRNESVTTTYTLRPTERGDYRFGRVMVFATTPMGLVARRFVCGQPLAVKVYPSFLKLKQYLVAASSNTLTESGSKRVRRAGNNTDFEQIRDYVQGDDYRTINWKATARRTHLMVNVYQDERSQEIYCLIDKGRLMQQSFEGMTLLDYAINSSLVLSYVAINKQDKAGLVTFAEEMGSFVLRHCMHSRLLSLRPIIPCFALISTNWWQKGVSWYFSPISLTMGRSYGNSNTCNCSTSATDCSWCSSTTWNCQISSIRQNAPRKTITSMSSPKNSSMSGGSYRVLSGSMAFTAYSPTQRHSPQMSSTSIWR